MLTRRRFTGAGVAAAMALAAWRGQAADPEALDALMRAFTGDVTPVEGGVTLALPALAEDGFSVPLTVEAAGAQGLAVFAPANPFPRLLTARFGPAAGAAMVTTRVRLADSQTVIALARFADGSVRLTSRAVTVAVGGCHV